MTDPRTTRRVFLGRAGSLALASSLAGCGIEGTLERAQKAATPIPTIHHPKVPIGDWTFSNWPLYIDKKVLKTFDQRYGGHVKYVEDINDNDEFYGKVRQQLQANQSIGRDIVVLTDPMAAKWVRNHYVQALDRNNIPNVTANLVDNLRTIPYDKKRQFTVPWQSGAVGLGYNPKKTGRELNSINDLFDPAFKGRVTMLSEPYDSASSTLLGMGIDPTTAKIDQILKAIDKIQQYADANQFRRFTGNDYSTDLTKGNIWVALAYSGDIVQLQSDNPDLKFVYPDEGAMFFTDNMMIPNKAEHVFAAETMMNFVYEPEIAAKLAIYVNYLSPVKGIKEIVEKTDPDIANNPLIFPPDEIRAKLHPYPALSDTDERTMKEAMAKVTGA
ncbi:spermidine/putrescine ABC transporter substrate-binding protein [Solirubrobacter ginsenosidimutans]|uniref:Spermidine/putrescine ABC transporter substrate-binding protein n=1 Tax=Solirubrobacter ginsenosidimutans TaxID=490573 RepID=A0A9X3MYP6_9ACTN|nr:spermidine/putrescine ABC transporter substrate-binding protein [Solirubrobacter ginsenosidimutans]MDA0163745.1 spermidine/putrescine ABC transporter substrate-binding protein [Solirubrobacter ginsenosidimutans]